MRINKYERMVFKHRVSERVFGADPTLPRSYFDDDSELLDEDPVDQAGLLAGAQEAAVACEALAESYEHALSAVAEMLEAGDIDRARAYVREVICGEPNHG